MYSNKEIEKMLDSGKTIEEILTQSQKELKERLEAADEKKREREIKEEKKAEVRKNLTNAIAEYLLINDALFDNKINEDTLKIIENILEKAEGNLSNVNFTNRISDDIFRFLF